MAEMHPLDDPTTRAKVVGRLLKLSPFMFALCYALSWVQGAEAKHCLLIAAVGTALCLGAALAIHVMGSKSCMALAALKIALLLVGRK